MAYGSGGDWSQVRMRCVVAWRGEKQVESFAVSPQLVSQSRPLSHLNPIEQLDTLRNIGSLRKLTTRSRQKQAMLSNWKRLAFKKSD